MHFLLGGKIIVLGKNRSEEKENIQHWSIFCNIYFPLKQRGKVQTGTCCHVGVLKRKGCYLKDSMYGYKVVSKETIFQIALLPEIHCFYWHQSLSHTPSSFNRMIKSKCFQILSFGFGYHTIFNDWLLTTTYRKLNIYSKSFLSEDNSTVLMQTIQI